MTPNASSRFERILVATDFSPAAERAIGWALTLARTASRPEIVVVHVRSLPREIEALAVYGTEKILEQMQAHAHRELDRIRTALEAKGIAARTLLVDGVPETAILEVASRESADAIVLGTHGRTGLSHVVLGSVAERVLRLAPCPVLVTGPGR